MAKKTQKQRKDPYSKYKTNAMTIYMMAMMVIYVLYCKSGYVDYDTNKEVLLLTITGIFAVVAGCLFLMTLFSRDGFDRIRRDIMPTDYIVFALVISWLVSYVGAADKEAALWGDSLRRMGLMFYLSFLFAFLVISHWGVWNRTLTIAFLVMCAGEWMMQILQYFGIDLFNWQIDHQYPYLIGTLGAVDQNAYFDGIVLTLVMCLFILESEKVWKIVYGIALFVGFLAGIHSNSDSFAAAFGMGILVMFGYCLYKGNKLLDLAMMYAIVYAAAWAQRICHHFNTYTGTYENHGVGVLESMIYSNRWMIVATVGLALIVAIALLLRKKDEVVGKRCLIGYLSVIGVSVVSGIVTFIYANVRRNVLPTDGILTKLVINDQFGNNRGYIWNRIINMMKQAPAFNKLFGFGFGNLSTKVYEYNADMDNSSWSMKWADGHNVLVDLLSTSGLIGVLLFIALCVIVCVCYVRAIKKNEGMILFLALFTAYLGAALINSNLIVTTPIIFMFLAVGNNYAHHLEKTDLR